MLWDSLRSILRVINNLKILTGEIEGWRNLKSIKSKTKSLFRACSQAVFKGKNEDRKKETVKLYLNQARVILLRSNEVLQKYPTDELQKYILYTAKFIDQIERRLLKGESIPSEEKTYSIFEEHTEWLVKGKRAPELGNNILITTNQYHLIMDYKIMYNEKDASQIEALLGRLKTNFPNEKIKSLSTDKGFYSKSNFEKCVNAGIENVIMPKKGKPNKVEHEREHSKLFISFRRGHSAVESDINMLEHHGLNRCLDRGLAHYEKYVALSVLAYNLHRIGNELVRLQRKKEEQAFRRKEKYKQAA